jgi:hypothetical protein
MVKSEAQCYLQAAPINTDPLVVEWWAANEINSPGLSVMARQYFGVPATSVSAERLFSLAGRAFDDMRQQMKEEMLEILMWARINKKNVWGLRDAAAATPPPLRSSRYIRYRDNIGHNQYGESYHIGNKQYSSKNLSYCPIHIFSESVRSLTRVIT